MPRKKSHRHRPEANNQNMDEMEENGEVEHENGGVEDLFEQLLEQRCVPRYERLIQC